MEFKLDPEFHSFSDKQGTCEQLKLKNKQLWIIQAIQEQMKIHGQEPVSFQDVKDEIFDMVKPKDPYKITLQDLVNSGQGDTVSSILIDLNGFWTYENREVLVANDTDSNTADLDDT